MPSSTQSEAVIAAEGLAYGTPDGRALARDVDFALRWGEILALTGPNGIGKSTLLRLVLGEGRATEGRLARLVPLREVAYVPQLADVSFHIPVTLGDVLRLAGVASWQGEAERIGLLPRSHWGVAWNSASGGERQKTLLTQALLGRPTLLVLDEPQNHLDAAARDRLAALLHDIVAAPRRAVLMVSHDPPPAARTLDLARHA